MMTIVLASLGFDERPILKAILRHYSEVIKGIKLIVPLSNGDSRVEGAIIRLRELTLKLLDLEPTVMYINPLEVIDSIRKIKIELNKALEGDKVLVVLGGGMRGVVIECLAATLLLPSELKRKVQIEVDLEFKEAHVSINADDLTYIQLNPFELSVLLEISKQGNQASIVNITTALGLPKSTTWKILKRLEKQGLLKRYQKERRVIYSLTPKGILNLPE